MVDGFGLKRFAHISDTHIRNLKYHYEYKIIFDNLYKKLREQEVDYIIHCGDIAHTKTKISPEFVDLASDFLKNLAQIAPTYIILGNHDGNLRNFNRQDALSPIVDALSMPNLHLAKKSCKIELSDGYVLNVLSVFDSENWDFNLDDSKVNIALYHGAVEGAATDVGYIIDHGDVDIQTLSEFDFAFLGDVHKSNQILDRYGRIRYAGSTVQQNHGETDDKGFLIWTIQGKDEFSVEHVHLRNPRPFKTINLNADGKIPEDVAVPIGSRLRVIANTNVSLDVLRKSLDVAKNKFKPETLTFLNKATSEAIREQVHSSFEGDLRDISVQEGLIKEYLKDYRVEKPVMNKILHLNKRYNALIEEEEESLRNVHWRLKTVEWDNLFNYGEDNSVDFEKLKGIVGIFGKNFSGKSSIIDSLLFGLFNTTSKPAKKNINFVNQNKQNAEILLTLEIAGREYRIERKIEKYNKKLKGKTTEEARVSVDFSRYNSDTNSFEILNGMTRANTDANVRKYLGSIDDFLITSMSSQHGALQFVNEGSTKRKEILGKFLDLLVFDQKHKLAKKDSADLKGALKKMGDTNFDDEIFDIEKDIVCNDAEIRLQKENCDKISDEIKTLNNQKEKLERKIQEAPTKVIDIVKARRDLKQYEHQITTLTDKHSDLNKEKCENETMLEKIEEFISSFDLQGYKEKKQIVSSKISDLKELEIEIKQGELRKDLELKKLALLEEVPCGPEFSSCKFIKDAYEAKKGIESLKLALKALEYEKEGVSLEIEGLEPEKIDVYLEKYDKVLIKRNKLNSDMAKLELSMIRCRDDLKSLKEMSDECKSDIEEYEKNIDSIEGLNNLLGQINSLDEQISILQSEYSEGESVYVSLHTVSGQLKERLEDTKKRKEEYESMQEEYAAYDLFMNCCHSGGISYQIIRNKLPAINNEIQKILENIVDFQVFFESEDKKLNILIKHPKHDPRPLELGSGAEKSMAAMAIRLALLNVSSLPKSDIFILDEPGTALDEGNLEGFTRIVDLIKSYFKTVLLISHMDFLKDIVDTTIEIEKVNGFARVNQ